MLKLFVTSGIVAFASSVARSKGNARAMKDVAALNLGFASGSDETRWLTTADKSIVKPARRV
jgi:hypothetical protein